jgi:hypothetical protein
METSTDERLEQAVATLNGLIAFARGCGLHDSAQFLAMARLNLQMDLNGITEEEFRALCVSLEGETGAGGRRGAHRRPSSARRQRTETAESGRTWRGPNGLASLHASRTGLKR